MQVRGAGVSIPFRDLCKLMRSAPKKLSRLINTQSRHASSSEGPRSSWPRMSHPHQDCPETFLVGEDFGSYAGLQHCLQQHTGGERQPLDLDLYYDGRAASFNCGNRRRYKQRAENGEHPLVCTVCGHCQSQLTQEKPAHKRLHEIMLASKQY